LEALYLQKIISERIAVFSSNQHNSHLSLRLGSVPDGTSDIMWTSMVAKGINYWDVKLASITYGDTSILTKKTKLREVKFELT
jgi:hypothetical protein